MPHTTARTHRTALLLLLLLLVALSVAAGCFAAVVPKHVCHYDEIYQDGVEVDLPTAETSVANKPLITDTTDANTYTQPKKNMRIVFSSLDLKNSNKYCDKAGAQRTDVFGVTVTCTEHDVLTEEKKKQLYKIVRSAINMHTARLKVASLQGAIVVPELDTEFCELFSVPEKHKTDNGVANADMVLYVASFPSSRKEMFAAGAPCALLEEDDRPVVGALTYTTKHITPTVYSVRVAMHEIAHALGFTYTMMEDVFRVNIRTKKDVRKKTVTEVQTKTIAAMVRRHYGCNDKRIVTGMELEDEAGILNVTSHSHWERRNALEELMAGIVTAGLYTNLTLAAFHEMKVYEADFGKAETMQWGSIIGCNFFTDRCVNEKEGKAFYSTFCVESDNIEGVFCAPGRRALGRCSPVVLEDNIPEAYQTSGTNAAGEARLLTDRCPIFEEHDDLSCTDEKSSAPGLKGVDSWCFRKFTRRRGTAQFPTGGCGKVSVNNDSEMTVNMGGNFNELTCKRSDYFNYIFLQEGSNYIVFLCPPIAEVKNNNAFYSAFGNESSSDETQTAEATHARQHTSGLQVKDQSAADAQSNTAPST